MKVIKKSLKINSTGSLVEWNSSLRRWELTAKSWSWSDIDPEYLEESRDNHEQYKEPLNEYND